MTTLNLRQFTDEVRQAGLSGLPCAWGEDGQISGRENLTTEQNAAFDALITAHVALPGIKSDLKASVDVDAEVCRQRYMTPGAGMAMTYTEKFAQAKAVHDLGHDAANALSDAELQFPTLAASVGIEAPTLWDCAQLVIDKYEQFAALSGIIERARLSGKKAISDASDADSARAAYEGITWPTP